MSFAEAIKMEPDYIGANGRTDAEIAEAEKELGKLEKNAFGAWTSIGIFRRYSRMSLLEKAEKSIVQAIKANPENLELDIRNPM